MKTEGMTKQEALLAVAQGRFVAFGSAEHAYGFENGRFVKKLLSNWSLRWDAKLDDIDYVNSGYRIAVPPPKEPERSHDPYSGPIAPGMCFVWEPDLKHARCEMVVTAIEVGPDDKPIVVAKIPPEERLYRNPIERFRQACVSVGGLTWAKLVAPEQTLGIKIEFASDVPPGMTGVRDYLKVIEVKTRGATPEPKPDPRELLARARELGEAATPGPWGPCIGSGMCRMTGIVSNATDKRIPVCDVEPDWFLDCKDYPKGDEQRLGNLNFIIESRTLLPALADALEDVLEAVEETANWSDFAAELKRIRAKREGK